MNTYHKIKIAPLDLIRTWNLIKSNPERVWIKADLFHILGHNNEVSERHMGILVSMGLVEQVVGILRVQFSRGKKTYKVDRNTKAWKVIKRYRYG